jgi:hypothetical protein
MKIAIDIIIRGAHQRMADDDAQLGIHAKMDEKPLPYRPEPRNPFGFVPVKTAGAIVFHNVILPQQPASKEYDPQ